MRVSMDSFVPPLSFSPSLKSFLPCLCGYLILHMWKENDLKKQNTSKNNRVSHI